jgi:type I restriction enzyme R subunit
LLLWFKIENIYLKNYKKRKYMATKEAKARIKINKLLENAGWRFFDDENGAANISLEPNVTLEPLDDDFNSIAKGFVDYLLLDERGFPLIVLEAKKEEKIRLTAKRASQTLCTKPQGPFCHSLKR